MPGLAWHTSCVAWADAAFSDPAQRSKRPQVLPRQSGRSPRARRPLLRHQRARFRQHHRPQRLRQDHDLQHHRRPDRARFRLDALSRRGDRKPARPRRLHDAEGPAVPLAHRARQRAARPRDPRRRPRRGRRQGPRIPQRFWSCRLRKRLSENTVGRHAPARGADPHADHGSRHPAARRAVLGAGLPDPALSRRRAEGRGRDLPQDRYPGDARHRRGGRAVEARRRAQRPPGPGQDRARHRYRRRPRRSPRAATADSPAISTRSAPNSTSRPRKPRDPHAARRRSPAKAQAARRATPRQFRHPARPRDACRRAP